MRLLIDKCLGRTVVTRLRNDGYDAIWIGERADDPGDRAILEEASADSRVIVTIDSDFGALVFRDELARVGVLRLLERPATAMAERARVLLMQYSKELEAGAFVTDDGDRARVNFP